MDKKADIFKFLKALHQNDGDDQDENHKHKTNDGMKDVDSKLQCVSSGFRCQVVTGSLMRFY